MLVLTRKPGERVHIGDDVEVVVLAVRGNSVRLGFLAPGEVPIIRDELLIQADWSESHKPVPSAEMLTG
jgi:carbon storage regulator